MSASKVTVAIPTYNRSQLLHVCLESVLAQDYPDFQVVVLDNASTDDTQAVVNFYAQHDKRVTYIRNETNIGMLPNFNRAIELNCSPYLNIFNDDDVMLPGFIRESVLALDVHKSAGFLFTLARDIDIQGKPLELLSAGDIPSGLISGLDYLELCISGRNFFIHPSSVLVRSNALAKVGSFDSPHAKHTIDFNLFFRLAAQFDIVFVKQELIHIRIHPEQESQAHWHTATGTGKFAMMAERIDAIAYLLQSQRALDGSYQQWLAQRLLALNAHKSELAYPLLPNLYFTWDERLCMVIQELTALIPPGDTFILVDQDQWGHDAIANRTAIPLIECDGQYGGPPIDDATAIAEFERLRPRATFIVFGWVAFWWLEYYPQFYHHLTQFRCVLKNTRVVVFELQPRAIDARSTTRSLANVTVTIPTYNRASLLKVCLASVLAQDYPDFRVVVLDNASDDDTEAVVRGFAAQNERVSYIRNPTNIGMMGNLNRAIAINSSPYLCIIHDDDLMLPGFLRESVQALTAHPSAACSFTLIRDIDLDGTPRELQDAKRLTKGLINGSEYLEQAVSGNLFFINDSSVLMRATALAQVGAFDSPHAKHTIDVNLYCRLAGQYDMVFIDQELIHTRIHPGQDSQTHWQSPAGTGRFAIVAEYIDAIAYLLQSQRAEDASYRQWLAQRLLAWNSHQSELAYPLLPNLYFTWQQRLDMVAQEITAIIPPRETLILVDQDQWGSEVVTNRVCIPFLERDGQYWGPPVDDNNAIQEFQRLHHNGANFIVFGWVAFWWLEHYSKFSHYLHTNFDCVLKNTRVVIFALRQPPA